MLSDKDFEPLVHGPYCVQYLIDPDSQTGPLYAYQHLLASRETVPAVTTKKWKNMFSIS